MKRKAVFLTACFMAASAAAHVAPLTKDTLKTNEDNVAVWLDGKQVEGGWNVLYGNEIDPLETKAREVVFASDIDTLAITLDRTWQSKDFIIVSADGKTGPVRVTRMSDNIYEDPNPLLLKRASSGLLSKEQADFDIRALIYAVSEIHPSMFSVCSQVDFFRAVDNTIATLPDSLSTMELYRRAAPLLAMLGDGHTNLSFPFDDVFTADLKRMPFMVDVQSNKTLVCSASMDSIIPRGAKIISINGVPVETMVTAMLPYVSGESEAFRVARVDRSFPALRHMLYPADAFDVVYLPVGEKNPRTVTYPATLFGELKRRMPAIPQAAPNQPYSFTIDKKRNVAIMDFRSFMDAKKMEVFADSMFRELRRQGIANLIIDLRDNGGGNSSVGDVLLRYLSPVPFLQMDKALVRISPLTRKLKGYDSIDPMFTLYEFTEDQYLTPRTKEEGHYDGRVFLLTSNITFSSAGSFAWTFKACGMGTVVGEETGGMNVSYGDNIYYRLPVSGLTCSISHKRFWQFHADERNIHGTIPDIAVPAADALDAALKAVDKKR